MNDAEPPQDSSTDAPPPTPGGGPRPALVLRSEQLLQGHKEVLIQHGAEVYRLRLTRQGKLILYK